jgi:hypothetical protein
MAKGAKKDELQIELADNLESWAAKYGAKEDPYVRGLTESLRTDEGLHIWATLDPTEYLPFPRVSAGSKLLARNRLIIILRNVLVFAPVALTWVAVGEATHAFGIYIRENTASVVNFLDFWENGYDILPAHYRIGEIARLDAYIIFAVIGLTLLAAFLGQKAKGQQHQEETIADRERMQLAVRIAFFLHDKQSINASTINQAVVAAIGKLLATSESLEATSKTMSKSIDATVKSITKTLDSTTREVGRTLNASTKAVNKSMETTSKNLGKFLTESSKRAAKVAKRPVREFEPKFTLPQWDEEESSDFESSFDYSQVEATEESPEPKKRRWSIRGSS